MEGVFASLLESPLHIREITKVFQFKEGDGLVYKTDVNVVSK